MILKLLPNQAIARLGRLTMLNASAVSAHERRDSELRYMRGVLGACQIWQRCCVVCQRAIMLDSREQRIALMSPHRLRR